MADVYSDVNEVITFTRYPDLNFMGCRLLRIEQPTFTNIRHLERPTMSSSIHRLTILHPISLFLISIFLHLLEPILCR